MGPILRLFLDMAGHSARDYAGRAGRASVLMVVAMVLLALGLAGFAGALWIALAREIGPVTAALVLGGLSFVLAALAMLIARAQLHRRQRDRELSAAELEAALTALMAKEEGGSVWTPIIAAAVLGFVITARR